MAREAAPILGGARLIQLEGSADPSGTEREQRPNPPAPTRPTDYQLNAEPNTTHLQTEGTHEDVGTGEHHDQLKEVIGVHARQYQDEVHDTANLQDQGLPGAAHDQYVAVDTDLERCYDGPRKSDVVSV